MGLSSLDSRYGLIGWADINGVLAIKPPGQGLGVVNLILGWNPLEKLQSLVYLNSRVRLPH